MTKDGFMNHLNDLAFKWKDPQILRLAGLVVPQRRTVFWPGVDQDGMEGEVEHHILVEDEFAATFGTGALSGLKARAFRGIWLFAALFFFYKGIKDKNVMK